jgi:hypothetical protein
VHALGQRRSSHYAQGLDSDLSDSIARAQPRSKIGARPIFWTAPHPLETIAERVCFVSGVPVRPKGVGRVAGPL